MSAAAPLAVAGKFEDRNTRIAVRIQRALQIHPQRLIVFRYQQPHRLFASAVCLSATGIAPRGKVCSAATISCRESGHKHEA